MTINAQGRSTAWLRARFSTDSSGCRVFATWRGCLMSGVKVQACWLKNTTLKAKAAGTTTPGIFQFRYQFLGLGHYFDTARNIWTFLNIPHQWKQPTGRNHASDKDQQGVLKEEKAEHRMAKNNKKKQKTFIHSILSLRKVKQTLKNTRPVAWWAKRERVKR